MQLWSGPPIDPRWIRRTQCPEPAAALRRERVRRDASEARGRRRYRHDLAVVIATVAEASAVGAHNGDRLFVPCSDGIVEVVVNGDDFTVGWTTAVSTPGPTIIAGDAVWTVATASGDLLALDLSTGKRLSSQHIGAVPSRFTSLAAGDGLVVVAAQRKMLAFGT